MRVAISSSSLAAPPLRSVNTPLNYRVSIKCLYNFTNLLKTGKWKLLQNEAYLFKFFFFLFHLIHLYMY